MGGLPDGIRPVYLQLIGGAKTGSGCGNFRVTVRSLHENNATVGVQAPADALESAFNALHGPGNDPGHGLLEAGRDPSVDYADAGQLDVIDCPPEKISALLAAFSQDDLELRSVDLQRDAGHSGSRAKVEQG